MKWLLPLFLGLVMAGCASTPLPQTKVLTVKESGFQFAVSVGTKLLVQLPSNPTTGYDWLPASNPSTVLKLIRSSYVRNSAEPGMVGVGGLDTFRFEALQPGRQLVQFNYVRPWEKGKAPAQTVSYGILVTP